MRGGRALNFDHPSFIADPYPHYRWLRDEEPIHRSPLGFWTVARYQDVEACLNDPRLSSAPSRFSSHRSTAATTTARSRLLDNAVTFLDPPAHTRLRALLSSALTAQITQRRQQLIETAVRDLLEPRLAQGEIDVIQDLALPLPTRVIADFLGIPNTDREHLRTLASRFFPIFPRPSRAPFSMRSATPSRPSKPTSWT